MPFASLFHRLDFIIFCDGCRAVSFFPFVQRFRVTEKLESNARGTFVRCARPAWSPRLADEIWYTTIGSSSSHHSSFIPFSILTARLQTTNKQTTSITMSSASFISQLMEPGGGVMLLPFVRLVIGCLLLLCVTAAFFDVARIHMVILSVLSGGLLLSLQFFESEFKKLRDRSSSSSSSNSAPAAVTSSSSNKASGKTD